MALYDGSKPRQRPLGGAPLRRLASLQRTPSRGGILRKSLLAAAALCVVAVSLVAGLANAAPKATVTAALVSDIGKFNDRGFNQNQLAGLNKAKSQLGVVTLAK